MNFVYLLKSLKDNKKYIGSTNNLKRRIEEHNLGKVLSTRYRKPFICLGYQTFDTISRSSKI